MAHGRVFFSGMIIMHVQCETLGSKILRTSANEHSTRRHYAIFVLRSENFTSHMHACMHCIEAMSSSVIIVSACNTSMPARYVCSLQVSNRYHLRWRRWLTTDHYIDGGKFHPDTTTASLLPNANAVADPSAAKAIRRAGGSGGVLLYTFDASAALMSPAAAAAKFSARLLRLRP